MAAHGARMVEKELEEEGAPVLFTESGMVRGRGTQATWNPLEAIRQPSKPKVVMGSGMGLGHAILKKKIK